MKTLLIVLNIILWTPFLKSQGNDKICLTISEMDYFVFQDLSQKALCKDTAEYKKQIATKNIQISLYKANEQDYKSQVQTNKILAGNYKQTANDFQVKYSKANDKAKFRGKILIGSLTVNLLFIVTSVILIK